MIGDFMKSPAWLANVGHVMAGALVALVAVLFSHRPEVLFWVEVLFFVYVAMKEFVIDLHLESNETIASSTVDAVGYIGGNVAGWGLVAWAYAIGPI